MSRHDWGATSEVTGSEFDSRALHPMPKAKPEQDLSNAIRLAVGSLPDVRLFRNNTGTLTDARGIPVSYGLAIGSADCVGIVAPYGRWLSIEIKRPGFVPPSDRKLAEARKHPVGGCKCQPCRYNRQLDWRDMVRRFGGVADIVDSVDGAMRLVERARVFPVEAIATRAAYLLTEDLKL